MSEVQQKKVVRRSALAVLSAAWVQQWAQRADQRPTWQDAAVGAGLLAVWALGRRGQKPEK